MAPETLPVLAFLLLGAPSAAAAEQECTSPMAEWQPREALQRQLEAKGWRVLRIIIDDGCYEVGAIDDKGVNVEAEYDPKTFALIELEAEG